MPLISAGLFLIPLSQLLPNHYPPWTSFHHDAFAVMSFGLAAVGTLRSKDGATWPTSAVLVLGCATIPLIQFSLGLIYFLGDAVVAALYIALFAFAIVVGRTLNDSTKGMRDEVRPLLYGLLTAAIISVGLAMYQWQLGSGLDEWVADVPPGGQAFANISQPNLLGTLTLIAIAALYYLHDEGRIGEWTLVLAAIFLCFGAALTRSRTAWLGMACLLPWLYWTRKTTPQTSHFKTIIPIAFGFVTFVLWIPALSVSLGLSPGRTLSEQLTPSSRLNHWTTLVDALCKEPLFGYGWNQVAVAQARVAADHPFVGEFLEHSHNMALDLMIWNGIPLGATIIGVVLAWLLGHARRSRYQRTSVMLGIVLVLGVHALVEFPMEYAPFLLTVGVLVGSIERVAASRPLFRMPLALHSALLESCLSIASWVAVEYLVIETNTQALRFDSARIGMARVPTGPPDVVLLTQQRELLRFARTQAKRQMTKDELAWMRHIADRFGYPPVLLRFALASALNGDNEEATKTLERLCKIQSKDRCSEGHDAWSAMIVSPYPEIAAVPFPNLEVAAQDPLEPIRSER